MSRFGLANRKGFLILLALLLGAFVAVGAYAAWKSLAKKKTDPLRVSIITDIHQCGLPLGGTATALERFLADSQKRQADFIVSLGDNASHRLGQCSQTGDLVVKEVASVLRSASLPVHFVLGDHDIESSVPSYQNWLSVTGREGTYYSFDVKDVHVIVLDTVLGGETLSPACEELADCAQLQEQIAALKDHDDFASKGEKTRLRDLLEAQEAAISRTRSSGQRDKGRLSQSQLDWLRQDLAATPLERLLIFSDHPLFHFISERKEYDIAGGAELRSLLEGSGKEIVAINGEAHLWHAEEQNGIRYYIVDDFQEQNTPWAFFAWPDSGHTLERVNP